MNEKPRLLLIAPYFLPRNYGGAVQIYDGLLRRMQGFDITVLSEEQLDDPAKLADFDERVPAERGYRIVRLPRLVFHLRNRESGGPLSIFSKGLLGVLGLNEYKRDVRAGFKRLLAELRPNVVVCGATFSTGWMMQYVPAGVARVNYIHGEELTMRRTGGYLDSVFVRDQLVALRSARLNLVVSQYTAETLQRIGRVAPERIALLPNAVDMQRFHPPQNREDLRQKFGWAGRTVLLTIARLIPRKGVDQVLRALAEQEQAGKLPSDWLYCIGGNGPEKSKLMELSTELGLGDRVQFLGFVADEALPFYYGAADLFALTNREIDGDTEGFGIVFIEANACGTPVLGGLAGGTAEAIAEKESGLRVDGDSVEAIGMALAELLNDPAERQRMADAGLTRVRHGFDLETRARELEALLNKAI